MDEGGGGGEVRESGDLPERGGSGQVSKGGGNVERRGRTMN